MSFPDKWDDGDRAYEAMVDRQLRGAEFDPFDVSNYPPVPEENVPENHVPGQMTVYDFLDDKEDIPF